MPAREEMISTSPGLSRNAQTCRVVSCKDFFMTNQALQQQGKKNLRK